MLKFEIHQHLKLSFYSCGGVAFLHTISTLHCQQINRKVVLVLQTIYVLKQNAPHG